MSLYHYCSESDTDEDEETLLAEEPAVHTGVETESDSGMMKCDMCVMYI